MTSRGDSGPTPTGEGQPLQARLEALQGELADHRRLQQELHRSERRFRAIFDHSNDAIFLVDVERDAILDVNAKACSMLGYERDELISVPMSVVHPHEMDRVRAFARSVQEHGEGFTNELTCLTKSGAVLEAEISGALVELEDRTCMIASVRDVTERSRLAWQNAYLADEIRTTLRFGRILGESPAMLRVLQQVEKVAPTDASVLISGESGTGKELVARAIHEHGSRRDQPLVRVNCASVPEGLFESEFFGHVKGAFTSAVANRRGRFELADGGTLFLDEVGEIPLALQGKLLRVLQEGEYERVGEGRTRQADVRLLAATNRDLQADVRDGRFRQDLYYRLGVFPVHVPPLRERPGDVALLARHFLDESAQRLGREGLALPAGQLRELERYAWPGNVRELQNVIERGVILARDGRLTLELGGAAPPAGVPAPIPPSVAGPDLTLADLKALERDLVARELEACGWKLSGPDGAAARLGLQPTTLAYRMKRMGLRRP